MVFVCYITPLGGRAAPQIIFHSCLSAFHPDQNVDGYVRQTGSFLIYLAAGWAKGRHNMNLIYQKTV